MEHLQLSNRDIKMNTKLLATLGPSSLNKYTVEELTKKGVDLFRINLSHTKLDMVQEIIEKIQLWTNVPISLDSEGAQIRNQDMILESVHFQKDDIIKIHHTAVIGDSKNISFTPNYVSKQLKAGDEIRVDFNSVCLRVETVQDKYLIAKVKEGGVVGSNKAADTDAEIHLSALTTKDKKAFEIGLKMGVNNFSLSFTNSADDVHQVREIIGKNANLISKIESIKGVLNLNEILPVVDQILIDRGDLSREVSIEKIPFIQRGIITYAKSKGTPVYVATNLLESMIKSNLPTRAEANDVASTLLMGASGLVLAAETAIGDHPIESVEMINLIVKQYERWTFESSFEDIIFQDN
jgi:pyruvate kinase